MTYIQRYNSTIRQRVGLCVQCNDGKQKPINKKGECNYHQQLASKLRSAAKQQEKEPEAESKIIQPGNSAELNRWFAERREEMTGVCANCGNMSSKNDNRHFKFSIAHILPKSKTSGFPSVAIHPKNWIELCFWGDNSCHTQMDNKMLDMTEMNCWNEIVTKFQAMYPDIAKDERRRIPKILRNYIDIDV